MRLRREVLESRISSSGDTPNTQSRRYRGLRVDDLRTWSSVTAAHFSRSMATEGWELWRVAGSDRAPLAQSGRLLFLLI